jgi:osmotically-inducible protein OsmY
MNKIKLACALALAVTLTGALPGCATYEKCGLKGCPGDAKITADVQAQLEQHKEIGTFVEVQTVNGVVYLNGRVADGLIRTTAESVANQTPGVAKVVDNIYVAH